VYFTAPAAIGRLGGSMNWLDAGGRYMLVRFGAEPSVHVYDRQNLSAGPYARPIDGRNYVNQGSYLGLSPDGKFVVGYDSRNVGYARAGQGVSWQIDHANRAIADRPNVFWSLCGDHGSFLSASDGRNYMITYNCYTQAGLWRVDITNNAEGLDEPQQQSLPNNKLLLAHSTWNDFGHVSTVARGTLRDWAFTTTEDATDTTNSGRADGDGNIAPWHSYRQEIVAVNVLTGEVRRLAHHRSRSIGRDYYSQPRLSASWGGAFVAFPSNFNRSGVVDIYAIRFGTTTGQNFSIAVSSNGTGSGTVSSSPGGIVCGTSCSGSYASGTVLTLTAAPAQGSTFVGWGGACTGTGTCSLTMSGDMAVTATFDASHLVDLQAHRGEGRHGKRNRGQLPRRHRVRLFVLGDLRQWVSRHADGDGDVGLHLWRLERGVQRHRDVHGAGERRHDRDRHVQRAASPSHGVDHGTRRPHHGLLEGDRDCGRDGRHRHRERPVQARRQRPG
jgi:hypothetical protein